MFIRNKNKSDADNTHETGISTTDVKDSEEENYARPLTINDADLKKRGRKMR